MKLRFLASLSVLLVVGCSQSPALGPASVSDASPNAEITNPYKPSGSNADVEAVANETLVSLSVPDMH